MPCVEPGVLAVTPLPKMIDAGEPGGRQLHHPEAVVSVNIGIQREAE
jgi:hypothetical protein